MKVSLFFGLQLAEPSPEAEQRLYHEVVEQALLAEALGYHGVWVVEHHGFYQCSHLSAPEVLLSFLAAKTARIRLGHGVTLLPYRYNHPIRVAERIATLDILSGGRVEWGTGKSGSLVEAGAFEIDPAELHGQWEEAIEIIPRMWSSEVFQHRGRHFTIPPTRIIPKPVQRPHPPIYAACTRPESVITAGRMGLGALCFSTGSDDQLELKIEQYRRAITEARPSGRAVNDRFVCAGPALVLPDDREACRHGFRGARFFAGALSQYYLSNQRPVGPLEVRTEDLAPDELTAAMRQRGSSASRGVMVSGTAVIGDPSCAREAVAGLKEAGVDELLLIMQLGTVPASIVLQSMRTFAERVLPEVS
jgi:alkanesulfonate monooxygenase SsuD/methylene tetrahydromethanopterin reductase-like flavin-dependent oxidoreductase (luciferase family)